MSEEIKNGAQDVELNSEELDKISGGYTEYEPNVFYQVRFTFTEREVHIIQNEFKVTLEAGRAKGASLAILASEAAPRSPSETP